MNILRATGSVGSNWQPNRPSGASRGIVQLGWALSGAVGLVWALTMGVAGGLMLLGASEAAPWLAMTLRFAGLTGIIAGVFVFQVLVANRLFPDVDSRLVRNVEAILGVALMIGVVLTILTLLA